jgi:predicted RNase H-like nuclease (RuvC/YqgF family)
MDLNEIKTDLEAQKERNEVLSRMKQDDIINFLKRKCKNVVEGNTEGYKLQLHLNTLEKEIKRIKDEIKETVFDELKDSFDWNGYNFKTTSGSGKYDFSCFDEWKKKSKEIKEMEENMKLAYKKGKEYIDSDTGEVYPIPEFKPYANRIVITKNKK